MKEKIIDQTLENDPLLSRDILELAFDHSTENEPHTSFADEFRNNLIEAANDYGVFCFSKTIENVMMWSHYANSHAGFALRFNISLAPMSILKSIWRVDYVEERPSVHGVLEGTMSPNQYMQAMCTKSTGWQYEEEYRFVGINMANQIIEFDPKIITGVVLGAKMKSEEKHMVQSLAKNYQLEVLEAHADWNSFKMTIKTA